MSAEFSDSFVYNSGKNMGLKAQVFLTYITESLMLLASWVAKKYLSKCPGQQNTVTFRSVLGISICTQSPSLRLISERK